MNTVLNLIRAELARQWAETKAHPLREALYSTAAVATAALALVAALAAVRYSTENPPEPSPTGRVGFTDLEQFEITTKWGTTWRCVLATSPQQAGLSCIEDHPPHQTPTDQETNQRGTS